MRFPCIISWLFSMTCLCVGSYCTEYGAGGVEGTSESHQRLCTYQCLLSPPGEPAESGAHLDRALRGLWTLRCLPLE